MRIQHISVQWAPKDEIIYKLSISEDNFELNQESSLKTAYTNGILYFNEKWVLYLN